MEFLKDRLKSHKAICKILGGKLFILYIKVRGPFVQTLCIEKDSYMDAI